MAMTSKSAFAVLLLAVLAGCTGQELRPKSPEDLVAGGAYQAWSESVPPYRIGEGDKLRIQFPLTPELNEEVLVRPDGAVSLNAAGEVSLASLSTADAASAIAKAAQKRLKNPRVEIIVTDPVSAKVYIGGEVKTPGLYPVNGPLTVVGAMMAAGGSADTARLSEVILLRRSPDNRAMFKLVDVHAALEGREPQLTRLYQGDIVYVPKTSIAELDLWIDQFINKVLPFNRNFDYTIGTTSTSTSLH